MCVLLIAMVYQGMYKALRSGWGSAIALVPRRPFHALRLIFCLNLMYFHAPVDDFPGSISQEASRSG